MSATARFRKQELNGIGPLAVQFLPTLHRRSVETSKHMAHIYQWKEGHACIYDCLFWLAMCSVEEEPIKEIIEMSAQSTCLCVGRIRWKSPSPSPVLSLKLRQPRRPYQLQNRAEPPQCPHICCLKNRFPSIVCGKQPVSHWASC